MVAVIHRKAPRRPPVLRGLDQPDPSGGRNSSIPGTSRSVRRITTSPGEVPFDELARRYPGHAADHREAGCGECLDPHPTGRALPSSTKVDTHGSVNYG